jgi:hypothetical protein
VRKRTARANDRASLEAALDAPTQVKAAVLGSRDQLVSNGVRDNARQTNAWCVPDGLRSFCGRTRRAVGCIRPLALLLMMARCELLREGSSSSSCSSSGLIVQSPCHSLLLGHRLLHRLGLDVLLVVVVVG